MADICVLYAREDEKVAEALHAHLSRGWDVWIDSSIVGSFPAVIEAEILASRVVIPIWSKASRAKPNVFDEITLARAENKTFLPIRIDQSRPPYGFGDLTSSDFTQWDLAPTHKAFLLFCDRLGREIAQRKTSPRPSSIFENRIALPAVFLSASSFETQISPKDAVRLLRLFNAQTALVSAYDLSDAALSKEMEEFRSVGGFVMLDSGNYEATRGDDASWTTQRFRERLKRASIDCACTFDVLDPDVDPRRSVTQIKTKMRSIENATAAPAIPIIHAPRVDGRYDLTHMAEVISEVAASLKPPLIAIPERELGSGLLARSRTMRQIRDALSRLPYYQPIHLLGTGNPWSIALLTAAGADSFDGLEWCRVVVDAETGRLHHFQHFDLFSWQARAAVSEITRAAMEDDRIDFAAKVALHNLEYYRTFTTELQSSVINDKLDVFLASVFPKREHKIVDRALSELLP